MITADDTALCAICGDDTGVELAWAAAFPGLVCTACEGRAVNGEGEPPAHRPADDDGDNPVFIDERKCWRKYREGGYVTMLDRFDCDSLEAYVAKSRPEAEPQEEEESFDEDGQERAPSGVAGTIGALREALARSGDERELFATLESGLARLRVLYKHDRKQFGAGDLAYLRGVGSIVQALGTFVAALDSPAPVRDRLLAIQPMLEPFAVGRRVAQELRALATAESEGTAPCEAPRPDVPRCPEGHRMVVRRGPSGRYWECTRHPECSATLEID